jgi:hypothetical protein
MVKDSTEVWRDLFLNWPASLPRRGVVVSMLNEAIPFKSFMTREDTLLLERTNPDPLGTRFIILAYDAIHLLKLTDPVKESVLTAAGYKGELSKM